MLGKKRFVTAREADGVAGRAADRQYRRTGSRQLDRRRRMAASAPDQLQAAQGRIGDAVVAARHNVGIVYEIGVSNARQPCQRLVVADDDRLVGRIGAAYQQRQFLILFEPGRSGRPTGGLVKKQVVHRRKGQNDAQSRQIGRNAGQALIALRPLVEQDDRPFWRSQPARFADLELHVRNRRARIDEHNRKGFDRAMFAFAQLSDGFGVAGVSKKMKPARALDGDNLAALDGLPGMGDRIAGDLIAGGIEKPELRAAFRAAQNFRMGASPVQTAVFGIAFAAGRKWLVAGVFPLKRQAVAYRVT